LPQRAHGPRAPLKAVVGSNHLFNLAAFRSLYQNIDLNIS
jgi:hypothetical protein